tara:strand:+ start:10173 stop:11048 length:876 start_codon:yes stop_codon:yes gene_type:complete
MFSELFAIIAPVFLIALIGYVLVRQGMEFPSDFITRMNMNIGAPALVFNGIMGMGDKIFAASDFFIAAFIAIMGLLLVSLAVTTFAGLPRRGYVIALYSTNSGNMGLPLCLFAFGEQGFGLGVAFFAVSVIFQFTLALFIAHGNLTAASLTRVTLLWGIALAFAFILTDTTPPAWFSNTTQLLGGLTIPLMLLTLGASLARLKVDKSGGLILLSFFKILIGVGIGYFTAVLFGFTGIERNVLILQSSMPVAIFSYLLASQYNRNPQDVAAMVLISTLMSTISIPVLLTWML